MNDRSQTDAAVGIAKTTQDTHEFSLANILEFLEHAVREGNRRSDEPNKSILTIIETQLELVRNGISDPFVVLSQFNALLSEADRIAQLTGDNYRVQHDLLCESLVRCALLSRLQILAIEKKTNEQLQLTVETSLLAVIETTVKVWSEFESKVLDKVGDLPSDNPRKKVIAKAESEVFGDISKTVSLDDCRKQIREAISKIVESGFRLSSLEFSKNDFFHSLDSLIGKLDRCSTQIGKDRRISELIRDCSDWMCRHMRFRFFLSEKHGKNERERIAAMYDPEPDSDNPLLTPKSKQLCRTLQGKLASFGSDPLALVCRIGVSLVQGRIPEAKDTAEQVKMLCKAIAFSGGAMDKPLCTVQRNALAYLSRILLDQQSDRRRPNGVQLEVSEIGLAILQECASLLERDSEGARWRDIKTLMQGIRLHSSDDQQRFIRQEKASDSYPDFSMEGTDSVFEEMIDGLGSVGSQIGLERTIGDMVSSYADRLAERRMRTAQEQYDVDWRTTKKQFWNRYPDYKEEAWCLPAISLVAAVALAVCGGIYYNLDASSLSSWIVWPARTIGCVSIGVAAVLAIMLLLRIFHWLLLLFDWLAIWKRKHAAVLQNRKRWLKHFAIARQFNPALTERKHP